MHTNKLFLWLDKKNTNTSLGSYQSNPYKSLCNNYELYYTKNELKMNKIILEHVDNYKINEIQKYTFPDEKIICIKDNTKRYNSDILFRELVDHCIKYNINTEYSNEPLINANIKNAFYKFLYDNSI